MLTERHIHTLETERGLDLEMLVRLGVAASNRFSPELGIEIPYFDQEGRQVNTKYRTITGPKQFSQDGKAKKLFWNYAAITDPAFAELPLIVTEGEFDAMAAIQAGFSRTVSVPDGAPESEQGPEDKGVKYSYVQDAKNDLRDVREIILCVDGDKNGTNLLNDLAIRFGKHRCKWVKYPLECKDLNDALKKYGVKGVVQTIAKAQWMHIDGLFRMSELPPIPENETHDSGVYGLSRHYKIRLGDFVVVTGIPSFGKTSFVNEVVGRMALKGWNVAIGSFEQKPQVDHKRNLRTLFHGKPAWFQSDEERAEADRWIDQRFSLLYPSEDDDVDLQWVLEKCQAAIVQNGAQIIVIDPWNEMDHIRPGDMSLTEYTGFAIKQFRKLAAKYQVHVIVVAHPTKLRPAKAGEAIPMPNLYDISDSAHWANKADIGIVVHRSSETRSIIRVVKSRYHDIIGTPGEVECIFDRDSGRYREAL